MITPDSTRKAVAWICGIIAIAVFVYVWALAFGPGSM